MKYIHNYSPAGDGVRPEDGLQSDLTKIKNTVNIVTADSHLIDICIVRFRICFFFSSTRSNNLFFQFLFFFTTITTNMIK